MTFNRAPGTTITAAFTALLFSPIGHAADANYYVPGPGEVFSYRDITPEIWDETAQNKKLDPMNELLESMRAAREVALNDPDAPQRFSADDVAQVEFVSSDAPWQALEEVFPLDWAAVKVVSPAELAQLRKALRVKTVVDHPDIKIIELALGAGAVLPRHADAAPGAFHIIEGSAEITVNGDTVEAYTGTSVKLESLVERRIRVTSDTPLKLLWFRWAPGGQQVYLDYGYYLTGSNFHAQPLESVMPTDYQQWDESVRKPFAPLSAVISDLSDEEGFYAEQRRQLAAMKKQQRFQELAGLYPAAPLFSNEMDVKWLDFENISPEGFFWAEAASQAGYALKAWNKMVRMKGVFQAKVPGSKYDFNISYIAVGPKGKYITHSHATPEFYYILGGETEWIVDKKRYVAKAGDMYVHNPYADHEMRGLVEGVPEVVITGSWSPFGDRTVFQVVGTLIEPLVAQAPGSFIDDNFNFHDFNLPEGLIFQKR